MVKLKDFYKGKKVFITGNTGFKGSWLSLWLYSMGALVKGYSLEPPTDPSLYVQAGIDGMVDTEIGDVRDYEHVEKIVKDYAPDIVFHMAAQPLVRDSYIKPIETYEVNVMGTAHILEAVRKNPTAKAVVNITTDKVYENKEWCWGYREDEPFGGYDPYSNSKACSELVTASFRSSFFNPDKYGESHTVALASVRAGNVIGGGDWAADRLIPDVLRSILAGSVIKIRNPNSIRPWEHVLEPLSGYLLLAKELFEGKIKYAEGWNFGPDDNDAKEVGWIVEKMCQLWSGASYEIDKGNHPHEAHYLKLDCSKAKTLLGWVPTWNIETTIYKIIEWMKGYTENVDIYELCLNQIESFEKDSILKF